MCNFLDYNDFKIVYKRYASLYFVTIVDKDDNELYILEIIHHYVEILDQYFGNVCELDIIFNFNKVFNYIKGILFTRWNFNWWTFSGVKQKSYNEIYLKLRNFNGW